MNLHRTKIGRTFAAVLIAAFLFAAASPQISQAQGRRLFGELTVIKNSSAAGEGGFVTVDGARADSGRSVASPSEIVTPPDASAKITFAQTGTVTVAPNSSVNLTFVDASIAGDLTAGELNLETVPGTTLNIFTRDGAVWTPNRDEKNTVKIWFQNGAARISVIDGQVMFNKVIVSAGETYPTKQGGGAGQNTSSRGISPLILVGIGGGIAAAVILALTISNSDDSVVSATR